MQRTILASQSPEKSKFGNWWYHLIYTDTCLRSAFQR